MNVPRTHRRTLARVVALIAALTLPLAACGDDDDAGSTPDQTTTTGAAPIGDGDDDENVVEVIGVDFEFTNLPDRVPAGTRLTFTNEAETELHELVAVRLADDEARSVEELVSLPPEEMAAVLFAEDPATVLLAAPGGEQIPAVGDGTLAEPGRYAILCVIPTGVDPQVYFDAAAETEHGPPQVDGGPPHIAHGMFAELIVE